MLVAILSLLVSLEVHYHLKFGCLLFSLMTRCQLFKIILEIVIAFFVYLLFFFFFLRLLQKSVGLKFSFHAACESQLPFSFKVMLLLILLTIQLKEAPFTEGKVNTNQVSCCQVLCGSSWI